jgi:SOS-response transcriptional repressor LexA
VRTLTLDGAEIVVQANADGTPASIVVVHAPDEATSERAQADASRYFGEPKPDTRTRIQGIKDGLSQVTDYCGRPVIPTATPSVSPSPT